MMRTSKQFSEFIKCKKIHCLLAPLLPFAGGGAASGPGGAVASEAPSPAACGAMQFEMRLQTVVGEFYSEVGYNFNFEKP